jgi:hypothetical protein
VLATVVLATVVEWFGSTRGCDVMREVCLQPRGQDALLPIVARASLSRFAPLLAPLSEGACMGGGERGGRRERGGEGREGGSFKHQRGGLRFSLGEDGV